MSNLDYFWKSFQMLNVSNLIIFTIVMFIFYYYDSEYEIFQ